MECGGRELWFVPRGCRAKEAARVLAGQEGRLEWDPARQSDRTAPADFVAPDGRRLLGSVPDGRLAPLAEAAGVRQAGDGGDAGRAVHLGAAYPLALRPASALVMGVAVALHVPLILSTAEGDWRGALAIGGLFAIGGAAVYSAYKADPGD
ncbi:hypothetical protein [Streptomyces sp. HNM0574]|uniref:hypothetical protein n=1 Tax=Streptomyces sp. HNM0574 TaxID=2714954 RepID=UPI00146F11F2|nr:hypothetical protein [Streptomyces sp. HNM0574]NLU69591.1 hypothetical protein [Streptomyces sp. HNM0574]